jgi:hypothetical protein
MNKKDYLIKINLDNIEKMDYKELIDLKSFLFSILIDVLNTINIIENSSELE